MIDLKYRNISHHQQANRGFNLSLICLSVLFLIFIDKPVLAQSPLPTKLIKTATRIVDRELPDIEKLYKHLHANPELSFHEKETAKLMAEQLQQLGFQVTENVGGYGVVGVMENGQGPTVLVRADMDALPIKEETNLPYASHVTVKDSTGSEIPVMHACGHDMHMAVWTGVASVLQQMKSQWKGTLVFIAQPAEEKGAGAKAMMDDGLYTRFPRPDYGLALHVNAVLPAGKLGYTSGHALANVDNISIKVKGQGGHGAAPEKTIDPIIMASKIILGLQSITARELSPIETPAVLSVGSIHGGTSGNIIPNEVDLEMTMRSYGDETRQMLLDKIKRVTEGVAIASGVAEKDFPEVKTREQYTPSVYNDPQLTQQIAEVFRQLVGAENVEELDPLMVGEDFGHYTRSEPSIPTLLYSLGSIPEIDPETGKAPTYFTHSSKYRPELNPTLEIGILSMSLAVIDLMRNPD
ncbi:amidohydrolase [Albibacterium indicum]|uniref:amidohydrolase n=1 Tax=Albibacterium indicum TaxID=2292082 RepID=UPI000E53054E|nr:amidohydrolase [Pedobacter indicus]